MEQNNEEMTELKRLWNSYFYPNSTVLINKLGITNQEELEQKEAEITFEKIIELYENPVAGNFDAEHLCQIHRYLFDELYEWAGEYRYVDIRKTTGFTSSQYIDTFLNEELKMMNQEMRNVHSNYSLASFLATYYVQLIKIHPFREGNGRAIREFLQEFVVAKTKHFKTPLELDWTKFNGDIFLENVKFSLVFRSQIENEFFNALVPANLEKNEDQNKNVK